MKPLKIGFVLDDGLDRLDGVQQYVLTMGNWLASRGHEVHYLVGQTKRTDIKNIHVLSRNLRVSFNANQLSTPLPAKKKIIKKLVDTEKFDILHVQVPYSPWMAARVVAAAPSNTKIVGTFHVLPYGSLPRVATRILGTLLHRNLRKFSAMSSVSAPAAVYCQQTFNVKSEVLPNAVDLLAMRRGKQSSGEKKIKVIFLGRLVQRKGCRQLIKSIAFLHAQKMTNSEFSVLVGGTGPDETALRELVRHNNLEKIVSFEGFIEEEDKADFLASADLAVFPSLGGESFGIVILEAMAAGAKVIIGGDNPGYRSVLGATPEALVDCQDHRKLAAKISEFMNSSSLRNQLNTVQQKLVSDYDVQTVGPKLEKIYRRSLAK